MFDKFAKFLESCNTLTNLIALTVIFVGAGLAIHKDTNTGGMLVTGGFAVLSNSIKKRNDGKDTTDEQTKTTTN